MTSPPNPAPARRGGLIITFKLDRYLILRILLPSPCRGGAGGEVTEESALRTKQPCLDTLFSGLPKSSILTE